MQNALPYGRLLGLTEDFRASALLFCIRNKNIKEMQKTMGNLWLNIYVLGIIPAIIVMYIMAIKEMFKNKLPWTGEKDVAIFLMGVLWPAALAIAIASLFDRKEDNKCSIEDTRYTRQNIPGALRNLEYTSRRKTTRKIS
jgi:hypothetical protein